MCIVHAQQEETHTNRLDLQKIKNVEEIDPITWAIED